MRIFKILILAALLSYILLACSKNNELVVPTASINVQKTSINVQTITADFPKGVWEGEYTKTSRDNATYFGLDIQDNGSLFVLNESHDVIGAGSWQLNDTTFNAFYIVYATQEANTIAGCAQTNPDKLFGKWLYDAEYQDSGKWHLDRAQ